MSLTTTNIVNFSRTLDKYRNSAQIGTNRGEEFLGGILKKLNYSWIASGSYLQVVCNKTGNKVAGWDFGWLEKDVVLNIVSVDELTPPREYNDVLLIALNFDLNFGIVCVFDYVLSKVLRIIQIGQKISCLHVVDNGNCRKNFNSLKHFDGIVAIGCHGGEVYLLDLCLKLCRRASQLNYSSQSQGEFTSSECLIITPKQISQIKIYRDAALKSNQHLALHLNGVDIKLSDHFVLKGPDGEDRIYVNKNEVAISSLHYCTQLRSLLIGYNFGAFQSYDIIELELDYTSPLCDEPLPIMHFATQEPPDDPRSFYYVWAIYSHELDECCPLAVMYMFCYKNKTITENGQNVYTDFDYASIYFQLEFTINEDSSSGENNGGRILAIQSINKLENNLDVSNDNMNEEDNLCICCFTWISNKTDESNTMLTLFDLNQWYKEQMPSTLDDRQASNYIFQICLNDAIDCSSNKHNTILDVKINTRTISQFVSVQRLEQHFAPNSLSFELRCLRHSDMISMTNRGIQKCLLAQIESAGPLCLIDPTEMVSLLLEYGLQPLFTDNVHNLVELSMDAQRETILNVALEHHLTGWLCKCAFELGNGSFLSTGCSFEWLVNWAYRRAIVLKDKCSEFCIPLFDYSETFLDNNTMALLKNCTQQIKIITTVYLTIMKKLTSILTNMESICKQYKSLEILSTYYDMVHWSLNVGLLPEQLDNGNEFIKHNGKHIIPYPKEYLRKFYSRKRSDNNNKCNLFIDSVINVECSGSQGNWQWDAEGKCVYPSTSFQGLLRIYLNEDVTYEIKHYIFFYAILDIISFLKDHRSEVDVSYLLQFPSVVKMQSADAKFIEACWHIDHGNYNTAMKLLLNPQVLTKNLKQWHHEVLVNALLGNNRPHLALQYLQAKKQTTGYEDVLMEISLYVQNKMLDEALTLKRSYKGVEEQHLFLHFLKECTANNSINSVVQHELSSAEEELLLTFLENSSNEYLGEHRKFSNLLRSYTIDVTCPRKKHKQYANAEEDAFLEKFISSYKKILPEISETIYANYMTARENNTHNKSLHLPNINHTYRFNSMNSNRTNPNVISFDDISDGLSTDYNSSMRSNLQMRKRPIQRIQSVIMGQDDLTEVSAFPKKRKVTKKGRRFKDSQTSALLSTPIVKRRHLMLDNSTKIPTPQSILKVKPCMDHNNSGISIVRNTEDKSSISVLESVIINKSITTPIPEKSTVRFESLINSLETSATAIDDKLFSSDDTCTKVHESQIEEEKSPSPVIVIEMTPKKRRQKSPPRSTAEFTRRSSPRLARAEKLKSTESQESAPEIKTTTAKFPKLRRVRRSTTDDSSTQSKDKESTPTPENGVRRSTRSRSVPKTLMDHIQ